eukprot:jgi/Antlo1/2499/1691
MDGKQYVTKLRKVPAKGQKPYAASPFIIAHIACSLTP